MKKRVWSLIVCSMIVCGILFGYFPDRVFAEEKGIVITNITSNSASLDWSAWAADHDFLSYYFYALTEKELGGADPNKAESYYDYMATYHTQEDCRGLEPNTKVYVCVIGNYFDWSEMVDVSNGREEKAIFAQFTTKGSEESNVKLNKKAASLIVGEKTTVKLDGVALSKQSFKSSNKKVAKVSGSGVVTAVKKGTCKLTVTDKNTNKRYICKITVKDKKSSKDFLSKKGLKVTPNGSVTVKLAVGAGKNLTDKVESVTVNTNIKTIKKKNGYVTDCFKVTLPLKGTNKTYNISAFDRYTGTSFESVAANLDNGSVHQRGVIVDVNGNKYDCSISADVKHGKVKDVIILEVTHPAEYDGVVFMFGQQTKTQMTAYNNIDFNSTFTVADYADVFIDGQTFFTVSGK